MALENLSLETSVLIATLLPHKVRPPYRAQIFVSQLEVLSCFLHYLIFLTHKILSTSILFTLVSQALLELSRKAFIAH